MAIVKRFITYKIPENSEYTKLEIWQSATETGSYALLTTIDYSYPTRATEVDIINTEKYYKVRFKNVTENRYSPYSDVFFGGHFDDKEGFAAITSTFDGAGYATTTQFYATTNIESTQIPVSDVQDALYTSRAFLDLMLDDQGPSKYFRNDNQQTTNRKWNAELELTRKAEIYFAASLVYNDMADDKALEAVSGQIYTVPAPADISPSSYIAGGDVSLPTDVLVSGLLAEPTDLAASGLSTPTDIVATEISPTGQIQASGAGINSVNIGQTSIGTGEAGIISEEIAVSNANVGKVLSVEDHNDKHSVDFKKLNDDQELSVQDSNISKLLGFRDLRNKEVLDYFRANIDKDIDISVFNEKKNLDAYKANVDIDIRISEYNRKKNIEYAEYLNGLQVNRLLKEADFFRATSTSYLGKATAIIQAFQPTFIPLNYGETERGHKFVNPGDIYSFTAASTASSGSLFTSSTATLTGFASGIQGSGYVLSNITVNGVSGSNVEPTESATLVVSSTLTVNGVEYYNDYWFNTLGALQVGQNGDSTSTTGFSIDYNTGVSGVAIRWNNIAASGGFTLEDGDIVKYTYTTV